MGSENSGADSGTRVDSVADSGTKAIFVLWSGAEDLTRLRSGAGANTAKATNLWYRHKGFGEKILILKEYNKCIICN